MNRRAAIRARAKHIFPVVKCRFGYVRVRYRGLEKNAVQVLRLIGLTNLYLSCGRLMRS